MVYKRLDARKRRSPSRSLGHTAIAGALPLQANRLEPRQRAEPATDPRPRGRDESALAETDVCSVLLGIRFCLQARCVRRPLALATHVLTNGVNLRTA